MVGFDHLHLHYNQQETTGRQLFLPLGPTYGMVEWSINRTAIHVYLAMCVYWRARLLHGNVYQLIDRFVFLKKVMSYETLKYNLCHCMCTNIAVACRN